MAITRKSLSLNGRHKQTFGEWLKYNAIQQGTTVTKLAEEAGIKPATLRSSLSKGRIQEHIAVQLVHRFVAQDIPAEKIKVDFNLQWCRKAVSPNGKKEASGRDLEAAFHALQKERKKADKHLGELGRKAMQLIDSIKQGDLAIFIGMDVLPWSFDACLHSEGASHITGIAKAILRGGQLLYIQPSKHAVRQLKKEWLPLLSPHCEKLPQLFGKLQQTIHASLVDHFKKSHEDAHSIIRQQIDQFLVDDFPYLQPSMAMIILVTQRAEDCETIIRVMLRLPGDKKTPPIFLPYWAPYCRDLKNAISKLAAKETKHILKAARKTISKAKNAILLERLEKVQRIESKLLMQAND